MAVKEFARALVMAVAVLGGLATVLRPEALSATPPPPEASSPDFALSGVARQGGVIKGQAPGGTRSLLLNDRPVALAPGGAFLIAFDRDAPPVAELRAVLADGREVRQSLAVAPGHWDVQSVDASITGSATSEEFKRRRAGELASIVAARDRMRPDSSDGWQQDFIWPVVARISGRFGSQRIYRGTPGSYHSGVDLAAGAGTTYVAPADGVVILAASAPYTLEGNLLIIDHGMGLNSAFLHSQRLLVKEGDVVRRGQPIGIVGATGRATGPHLHWGMKWQDARLDPVPLVRPEKSAR
ncbi:MAG TPA: M23 family metallopeptidase [Sphingobium sp.]|uniref:M23 family metallopeptidase n=1 Tax=Sphingobium sp. TaxID=1912891 RepID=UPI002ED0D86C